jgi:hypothetical protein
LSRPLLAFAEGVKAVAKLAGNLGLSTELGHERGCPALAAGIERADRLMDHLPRREARVGPWVQVGGEFELVRYATCRVLIGELQSLRAEPVDGDNGDQAVRQDPANHAVGLNVFECGH